MSTVAGLSQWLDRHRQPTLAALLSGLSDEQRPLVEAARATLGSLPGVTESVAWRGLPWRWCLCYSGGNGAPGEFAWIVPDPNGPFTALSLAETAIAQVTLESLPKSVRYGVLHGNIVGTKRWVTVPLDSENAARDIGALAATARA